MARTTQSIHTVAERAEADLTLSREPLNTASPYEMVLISDRLVLALLSWLDVPRLELPDQIHFAGRQEPAGPVSPPAISVGSSAAQTEGRHLRKTGAAWSRPRRPKDLFLPSGGRLRSVRIVERCRCQIGERCRCQRWRGGGS